MKNTKIIVTGVAAGAEMARAGLSRHTEEPRGLEEARRVREQHPLARRHSSTQESASQRPRVASDRFMQARSGSSWFEQQAALWDEQARKASVEENLEGRAENASAALTNILDVIRQPKESVQAASAAVQGGVEGVEKILNAGRGANRVVHGEASTAEKVQLGSAAVSSMADSFVSKVRTAAQVAKMTATTNPEDLQRAVTSMEELGKSLLEAGVEASIVIRLATFGLRFAGPGGMAAATALDVANLAAMGTMVGKFFTESERATEEFKPLFDALERIGKKPKD